jgi:hypothetical protein
MNMKPVRGPFHWNAGAWFGSQIGGSIWLLIGSLVLWAAAPAVAAVWLGGFVLCCGLGLLLWFKRDRVPAYTAYQGLFATLGVIALLSIVMAHRAGQLQRLVWGNAGISSSATLTAYAALLVFPSLMLRFYLRERSARNGADTSEHGERRRTL